MLRSARLRQLENGIQQQQQQQRQGEGANADDGTATPAAPSGDGVDTVVVSRTLAASSRTRTHAAAAAPPASANPIQGSSSSNNNNNNTNSNTNNNNNSNSNLAVNGPVGVNGAAKRSLLRPAAPTAANGSSSSSSATAASGSTWSPTKGVLPAAAHPQSLADTPSSAKRHGGPQSPATAGLGSPTDTTGNSTNPNGGVPAAPPKDTAMRDSKPSKTVTSEKQAASYAPPASVDPAEAIRSIERKLRSYGPYVRVFRANASDAALMGPDDPDSFKQANSTVADTFGTETNPAPSTSLDHADLQRQNQQQQKQPKPDSHTPIPGIDVAYGSAKDLNLIDVSATRTSATTMTASSLRISAYPTVIRTPLNLGRVTVGTAQPGAPGRASSPSQITLIRPIFTRPGPRYARSNSASQSSRGGPLSYSRESAPAAARRSIQSQNNRPIMQTQSLHSHAQRMTSNQESLDLATSSPDRFADERLVSVPIIPFLVMSNSLQLHLKLNVLADSERIVVWIPGSFVAQSSPFFDNSITSGPAFAQVKSSTPSMSSDWRSTTLSAATANGTSSSPRSFRLGTALRSLIRTFSTPAAVTSFPPQPLSPGYLLLTSTAMYIFRPSFSLFSPKIPLMDEQTSYLDPSELIELVCRFSHLDIARIDVGPSRQHLVFRVVQGTQSTQQQHQMSQSSLLIAATATPPNFSNGQSSRNRATGASISIASWAFLTRSRSLSTQIIDYMTMHMHEMGEGANAVGFINQDIEYTLRNLKNSVFLRQGPREIALLTYGSVWSLTHAETTQKQVNTTPGQYASASSSKQMPEDEVAIALSEDEVDGATSAEITKVDFDFLRFYILGCFLRYIRPMKELSTRSVKLQHVSIIGTYEYVYVVSERMDAWPPLIMPSEFSPHPSINARIDRVLPGLSQQQGGKGYVADIVPHFENILGVGRINDVIRIERWRTWRIDAALNVPGESPSSDFLGLGEALQNGVVGFFGPDAARVRSDQQQGTASGWLWWVRIIFGERVSEEAQTLSPSQRSSHAADTYSDPISDYAMPMSAPTSVPRSSRREKVRYWWDLSFSTREAVDELFDAIQAARGSPEDTSVTVVCGDD